MRCQRHVSETAERHCDRSALPCLVAWRDPGARAFSRDLAVSSGCQTANAHHPVNTIGWVVGLSLRGACSLCACAWFLPLIVVIGQPAIPCSRSPACCCSDLPAASRGAESVIIAATHGLLSGPAVERLKNAPVREVVVTNTLPIGDEKHFGGLTVLSIAPIVAEALAAVFADESVSEIFRGDNL